MEVVYKWKSAKCHTCKVFGHSCKLSETKENGKEEGKETREVQLSKVGCLGPAIIWGHPPTGQEACHEVGTQGGGKETDAEGDNKGPQNKDPKHAGQTIGHDVETQGGGGEDRCRRGQ